MNPLQQISTEEVPIKIDIRGPSTSSTVSISKKDENREETEEEDHSKTVPVLLTPEQVLLIELKTSFAESYPCLGTTYKVRICTTKSKQQESRFIAFFLSCEYAKQC